MGDYPRWADPFLAMYASSPIATAILNDRLEILWENETMQNDTHLICRMNLQDCLAHAGQNGLLQRLQQGKSFTFSEPGMFSACSSFVFQPQIDASGILQGALVHYWGENSVSSQPIADWRSCLNQPISIFSHQFRTPLSQIFSALNLLQIDHQQDQALQTYLRSINWSCYRLLRTVINFSTDQQIQSGQLKSKMLAGDLCRFMQDFCQDASSLLQGAGYHFYYEIPSVSFVTLYDSDLLSRALCNLLSNACKFTEAENSKIVLKMAVLEKQATITITDNGYGMPPQVLQHAFSRFYSFDPIAQIPCGDGLGLFICRFVLQLHHGTIALQSKEGAGTTAALTLPLQYPGKDTAFQDDSAPVSKDRFSPLNVILSDVIAPDM